MADPVTIEGLHEAIKQALAQAFPVLVKVDDYPTECGHIKVPAAFLDLVSIEPNEDNGEDGTGQLVASLRWEISLVLGLTTQKNKRAARALAANVALWVQGNRFGLHIPPAQFLRAAPDEFSPQLSRHTPWVVEFGQEIHLGESAWDGTGVIPSAVYVGFEPDTGLDHVDDYLEVVSE